MEIQRENNSENVQCNWLTITAPEIICVREGSSAARRCAKLRMLSVGANIGIIAANLFQVVLSCALSIKSDSEKNPNIHMKMAAIGSLTCILGLLILSLNATGWDTIHKHATKNPQDRERTPLKL